MRRLALLVTGGALWLFLAALPALADGGPHVVSVNDGSLGISADSCAGCHRAHTAQGSYLINAATEEDLCLTCHGSGGVGSTVDVMTGVQYKAALAPGSASQGTDPSVLLGALRNGGFDEARIDAGNAVRITYYRNAANASNRPFVGVGAPEDVTSAHIAMVENGLEMPGIAWGNGPISGTANAGPAVVELSCANCHNPHGNGQFRILNPIPSVDNPTIDPDVADFTPDTAANVVTDYPIDNPNDADTDPDVKNYTIIQTPANLLYAEDVIAAGYGPEDGDYMRRTVPWRTTADRVQITDVTGGVYTTALPHGLSVVAGDTIANGDVSIVGVTGLTDGQYQVASVPSATTFTIALAVTGLPVSPAVADQTPVAAFSSRIGGGSGTVQDAPNGDRSTTYAFLDQMTAWCVSCHTRYLGDGNYPVAGNPYSTDSGDAIYKFRHPTRQNRTCTTCHVSHGSNAEMPGEFSSTVPYPDGHVPTITENGNSRLLKIDNRGTCQACHDPTETVVGGELLPTNATLPAFP